MATVNAERLNGPLLQALVVEINKHRERHEREGLADLAATADEAQARCRAVLLKVKRVLQLVPREFLGADAHADPERLLAATQVLRIVFQGEFCRHASAVFEYGNVEMVGPPLGRIVALLCQPALPVAVRKDLVDTMRALGVMLARQNPALYNACLADAVAFVRGAVQPHGQQPHAAPFSCLGAHAPPHASGDRGAAAHVFHALASVPVAQHLREYTIGLHVLLAALPLDSDGAMALAVKRLADAGPADVFAHASLVLIEHAATRETFPDALAEVLDLRGVSLQWARPCLALLSAVFKQPMCRARVAALRLFARLVHLRPELVLGAPPLLFSAPLPLDDVGDDVEDDYVDALAQILAHLAAVVPARRSKRARLDDADVLTPDARRTTTTTSPLHEAVEAILDAVHAHVEQGDVRFALVALGARLDVADAARRLLDSGCNDVRLCLALARNGHRLAMRSIQSVFARAALPATAQVRRAASELYAWGDGEFQSTLAGVLLHEPVDDVALLARPLAAELKTSTSPRVGVRPSTAQPPPSRHWQRCTTRQRAPTPACCSTRGRSARPSCLPRTRPRCAS